MDEINDQTESMKQIQEALSAPIGAAADFDEVWSLQVLSSCMQWFIFNILGSNYATLFLQDELEAELEELEGAELEEELFQPATTAPAATVHVNAPVGRQPTQPAPQRNNRDEDELAALQAEMAL